MTRERMIWLLAVLALVAGAWWLSANTEWVDEQSSRGATGEARRNPAYAFEQLLRRLGMRVEHLEALPALPPTGARLVLLSHDWQLFPGRAAQLRHWVAQGGHLVLTQPGDWDGTGLKDWVPVTEVHVFGAKPEPQLPAAVASALRRAQFGRADHQSTPALWGDTARITTCQFGDRAARLRAAPGHAAAWSLTRVDGTRASAPVVEQQNRALQAAGAPAARAAAPAVQALRLPIGQGSVTVLNSGSNLFFNVDALACENPLLLAAAVQAEPGAVAWVYLREKREALLPWIWHEGWIAVVAGALALAAALWRGAVRFGPRLAEPPRLRRSIAEQVRGLAAYLQRGGADALLAAQQRALDEAATRMLRGYARLPLAERAQAVAAATGLARAELATAMAMKFCTRAQLPHHLQLLEAARRRLLKTPEERPAPP